LQHCFVRGPGRLEWRRTVDSSLYREIAGLIFPGYFWMGCRQCDHVSQMNRNPAREVGVVHRMKPCCQLSQGTTCSYIMPSVVHTKWVSYTSTTSYIWKDPWHREQTYTRTVSSSCRTVAQWSNWGHVFACCWH